MTKKLALSFIAAVMMLGILVGCNESDKKDEEVRSISFDKEEITLAIGESTTIEATIKPSELSDEKLTWKSSDESVATVSRGLVTAVSKGQTVITATSDNGKVATCTVTVIKKNENNDEGDDDYEPYIPIGGYIGNKCPSYPLELVDGSGTVSLNDFSGKTVVINFWGTWCGPCKAELPHFNELATEYKENVVFLIVHSVDEKEDAPNYINKNFPNSNMIFAYDLPLTAYVDKYFSLLGGSDYYPRTLVLDENGIITYTADGAISYDQLKSQIENALSKS